METGQRPPAAKAKPAVASHRTGVAYPPPRRSHSKLLAVAAVLVAAAVGLPLGARYLGVQSFLNAGGEAPLDQAVPLEETVAVEPAPAPPKGGAKAAAAGKQAAATKAASPRPSGPARATAKPVRPANQAPEPAASAPDRGSEADAPPEPPPVETMARAEPAPTPAPQAPTGKFFEPTEVDEPPQVASRVEPRLPPDLPGLRSDLVVVRVLVSQSGHPFRVTLLRKSRLGRALDDAVIEAVTQWTFAPARKRGAPVNAWYHIGVPLGGAD